MKIEDKKLIISKSYKNKEEDNKVMKEEPKKTWRFGIKDKENEKNEDKDKITLSDGKENNIEDKDKKE